MSKVLIVGLDGAAWGVLNPLINQGVMPALEALIRGGSYGNLESVIPPVTAPAWSSFMTGRKPDKHGVLEFRIFDVKNRNDYLTNGSCIRGETIWQILSRHGKKIIVLNLPYTYPVYPVNGILVSGMDTPSKDSDYCHPLSVRKIIEENFPDYTPAVNVWDMRDAADEEKAVRYVEKLERLVDLRTELFLYLLSEYKWDAAMVHYQETDYLQHLLWDKVLAIARSGEDSTPVHQAIRNFYKKIDDSIRALGQNISPDETALLVVSDHGCVEHRGVVYPNVLLEAKGLLVRAKRNYFSGLLKKALVTSDNAFVRRIVSVVRKGKAVFRDNRRPTLYQELRQDNYNPGVNWDRSRAVMVMGSQCAFIYVREKKDIPLCRQVLTEEYDKAGSRRLFQKILTFQQAYQRPSPDSNNLLIAVPAEGFSVSRRFAARIVSKSGGHPGIHHPQGIFAARGKHIRKGKRPDLDLIDIAPTCLHLLDLPVSPEMDGKVARSLVTKDTEVKTEKDKIEPVSEVGDYDRRGREIMEKRLRTLGYIE